MPYRAIVAHKLIVETAKELTHELYSQVMADDLVFKTWRERFPDLNRKALEAKFVETYLPRLIEPARTTLTLILRDPTKSALHEPIREALIYDASVRHMREAPPIIQEAGNV